MGPELRPNNRNGIARLPVTALRGHRMADKLSVPRMSAIGPKRTPLAAPHMSAFGGKADIPRTCGHVGLLSPMKLRPKQSSRLTIVRVFGCKWRPIKCALLPVCQDQEGSGIGDEKYENEKVRSRDSARKPEQDVRRIERVSDVSVRTITREEIGRLGVKRGFGAS